MYQGQRTTYMYSTASTFEPFRMSNLVFTRLISENYNYCLASVKVIAKYPLVWSPIVKERRKILPTWSSIQKKKKLVYYLFIYVIHNFRHTFSCFLCYCLCYHLYHNFCLFSLSFPLLVNFSRKCTESSQSHCVFFYSELVSVLNITVILHAHLDAWVQSPWHCFENREYHPFNGC